MPEPLRICCVTASLTAGGAQRVMATMTDYWVARDHDVTFVTLSDRESDFFPLRPGTHRVALELLKDSRSLRQAVSHNWERVRELRETIRQSRADVVISFLNTVNVLTIFAARGLGIPVVVSERNNPWQITMGYPWRVLRRLSYPRAAALVVQTEVGKEWADRITDPKKAVVIPNPISERFARLRGHEHTSRRPVVLAMGKLHPQKGFDVLIDAFAQVAARHLSWTLVIAGKAMKKRSSRTWQLRCCRPAVWNFPASSMNRNDTCSRPGSSCCPPATRGSPTSCWRRWRASAR